LLTEKWIPAVPYFQILCIAGIMYPLHVYNLNILKVKGRSDLFFKLEIIKKVLISIGIVCAIPFGIYGLLYLQVIISGAGFFINTWYSGLLIDYPEREQLSDVIPILGLSGLVGCITWFIDVFLIQTSGFGDVIKIMALGLFYFSVYFLISYFIKMNAIVDFQKIVFKK
jgi:O-antigen/teichoic acid export membrane protein